MVFLVVGDANTDLNAALARFPREGDDSRVDDLVWSSGGSAVNVATALALLGARVRLLARVGIDPAADVALRAARRAGVDLGAVQRDEALATGLCFVGVSPGGERTFFSFRGANTAFARPGEADLADDAAWLHVCGHALLEGRQRTTTLDLIATAASRGLPVSLDLCLPLLHTTPADVLALAPRLRVLFANEPELAALARSGALPAAAPSGGGPIDAVRAAFAPHRDLLLVAKLGGGGSIIGDATTVVPAFPVDARDTTGCGDAYAAGFLFAHTRGAPPEICGRLGNALGALTATRRGSADVLPGRAEVRAFLDAHAVESELDALLADPR